MDTSNRKRIYLNQEEEELFEKNLIWIFGYPEQASNLLSKHLSAHDIGLLDKPQLCKNLGALKVGLNNTKSFTEYRKDQDYFFSNQYHKTWMFYLRRLILNRIYAQFPSLTKKIIINEPEGLGASFIISQCFPHSKLIILVEENEKAIESFTKEVMKNKKKLLVTSLKPDLKEEEIQKIVKHRWLKLAEIINNAYNYKPKELRYLVNYEDLKNKTNDELEKIFRFLGIKIHKTQVEDIIKKFSKET